MQSSRSKAHEKVVIIGGGPIGMFTAIKLKQLGLDVIIIEQRNLFTRPGMLDPTIFQKISDELKEEIVSSSSHHIKDVERSLDKIIKKHEIERKIGCFTNIIPFGIEIKTEKGLETYPCDFILDATGSKREVIQALNRYLTTEKKGTDYFQTSVIGDNPIKTHFIAYVGMEKKDAKELDAAAKKFNTISQKENVHTHLSEQQLVEIGKLCKEFQWDYFSFPQLIIYPLEKNKACLYLEIPSTLPSSMHEHWLKNLIKLMIGRDISFTYLKVSDKYKFHPKPRFNRIYVEPKIISPLYFASHEELPAIIPIGDAIIEPDYRLGIGVKEGMKRTNILLSCLEIKNNNIVNIQFEEYNKKMDSILNDQKSRLKYLYTTRKENLELDDSLFFTQFLEIKSEKDRNLVIDERIKKHPKDKRQEMAENFLTLFYERAKNEFLTNVLDKTKKKIDTKKFRWSETLTDVYNWLSYALKINAELKLSKEETLLKAMNDLAIKTKELASTFLEKKPELAKKYYLFSLKIYEKHFTNDHHKEFLTLCSNLMITANKLKRLDLMIYYADKAFARADQLEITDTSVLKIMAKIIFNKINAVLQKSISSDEGTQVNKSFDTVNNLLAKLNSENYRAISLEMKAIPLPAKQQNQYEILSEKIEKLSVAKKPSTGITF